MYLYFYKAKAMHVNKLTWLKNTDLPTRPPSCTAATNNK